MTRRLLLLVVAALAAGVVLIARPAVAEDCAPVDVGDPGKRFPVVLIHGFNGDRSAMAPTRDALVGAGLDVHIVDFEYPCAKTEWVENPNIGLRLQNAIKDLADTSMSNGGPGRVAVIGHSMGGLATRQALTGGDLDGRIAFVATYGTPHTGSTIARELNADTWDAKWVKFNAQTIFGVPLDSNAGQALQAFSEQINRLQPISGTYPVLSMAGDYVITERLGNWVRRAVSYGDLVVDRASALQQMTSLGDLGGQAVTTCEIAMPVIRDDNRWDDIRNAVFNHSYSNRKDLESCYHGNLMRDPNLQRITVEQMRAVIDRTERRTPPDPCARVIADLNANGGNPYGVDYELDTCEGGWAVAVPVADEDDSGDGLIIASLGDDGRWVKRGLVPGMTCGDIKGLGAPESVWRRGNGGCNSDAISEMPPCGADLLAVAYNDFAGRDGPYVAGDGEEPDCRGVVALAWVTPSGGAEGEFNFLAAAFVARSGRWKALAGFRPGDDYSIEAIEEQLSEATPEERETLTGMLLAGWIAE